MEREELRAAQGPLKERYKEEPKAAVVTLAASGELGEGISCSVQTGRAIAEAGLHPASGGDGSLLCSGDMLLEALVACAGVTLQAVATSLGVEVEAGTVRAEGELDFRGTLAVDREAAGRYGVDVLSVGQAFQFLTDGVLVGRFRPDDAQDELDIRVRFPMHARSCAPTAGCSSPDRSTKPCGRCAARARATSSCLRPGTRPSAPRPAWRSTWSRTFSRRITEI